jgi:23S rRNA pseudouridine1911/1915/1917 synthase
MKDKRIDKALAEILTDTRSKIEKEITLGYITLNGNPVKTSYKLQINDEIQIRDVPLNELKIEAEDLGINIVYEDDDVAVVYKPKGMVVHPGAGNYSHTLVNGIIDKLDFKSINNTIRPGIVHRIDKDTSGLLMIAKNEKAMLSLQQQLKEHTCNRHYVCLVYGEIGENKGRIDAPIGRDKIDRKKMAVVEDGKNAVTNFTVLKRFKGFTFIECVLETGRTHQIRVHMKYIGHPLVGDKTYGPRKTIGDDGQFLHAKTIGFIQPTTKKYLEFDSEIPEYMIKFMSTLEEL